MNASLGLVPTRSLLQLGLRFACRPSAASRFLSTCTTLRVAASRPQPPPTWTPTPTLARNLWPSATATTRRWASSSAKDSMVITDYEELPLDYKDKLGLSFRVTPLSAAEVKAVFGPGMKPNPANRLLRVMHGRRVAGTLDDPAFAVNTAAFSQEQKDAALAYLRKLVHVDEVMNAGLRAEDELAQLEKELAGQTEGKDDVSVPATLKKKDGKTTTKEAADVPPKPDPVYGYSALDAIRAKNMAKAKEREERLAAEAAEKGLANPGTLSALPIKRPPMSARMQRWMEQGGSDLQAPPELTLAERLLPSFAAVLLLTGLVSALAMVYTPPREADRMFPEVSASSATVAALIGLNVLVFAAWRIPPFWRFLNTHFTLVHGMPRAASMLLANFSHSSPGHIFTNMLGLWFVGTALHDEVGRADFLAIYLSSGAVGLLGSLTSYTLRGMLGVSTLGASGAVFGVTTAYFWMHRYDTFKILGLPPDPMNGPQGLGFIAVILGFHVYAIFRTGRQTIDITSHLFGMLAGLIGIELVTGKKEVEKTREDLVKDAPPREDA